jgi:hypothetical protein
MSELLKGVGITGVPALAIVAIAWIIAKATERIAARREAELGSHLRQIEARFSATLQAQAALDVDLRNRRVNVYGQIWSLGDCVSRWPKNEMLTFSDLDALHLKLKDWYFGQLGGLWLSASARAAYGTLQEELDKSRAGTGPELVAVNGPDYDRIMQAFSALRTELTEDLQSRIRPVLTSP